MRLNLVIFLAGVSLIGCLEFDPTLTRKAVILQATNSNNAYTLINKAFAPRGGAIEAPECGHWDFGPHITQAFDKILGKHVFRFHIHRDKDNDRCIKFDRQRNEIKVFSASPPHLKAKKGNVFTYNWKFRLDKLFQASRRFTHLHQIKAVGGPCDGMPLITLSARKGIRGGPDKFELNYGECSKQNTISTTNLQPFLGQWIEATQQISYGENGKYSVSLKSVTTNETLFVYKDDSVRMWKTGAQFCRPKWGIYRSLADKDNLRDEIVDFADIRISYR